MSFASREKALLSQFEVGVGLVAGGGPMARLPRVMGRGRALEVLLSADDIRGADAELLGYVNRTLPDAGLDCFVDALATRIASFDKWAIANTKRLVNEASLPPDVEIRAGWDACMASVKRPAAQERIKALLEQGFQKPGDPGRQIGSDSTWDSWASRATWTPATIDASRRAAGRAAIRPTPQDDFVRSTPTLASARPPPAPPLTSRAPAIPAALRPEPTPSDPAGGWSRVWRLSQERPSRVLAGRPDRLPICHQV